ncbi:hypothetical protein D3C86_1253790 [compost metagenome]
MPLETKQIAHRRDDHMPDGGFWHRLLRHMGEVFQHKDRLCAGILKLMFQFARCVERIDIDHDHASSQDPVYGDGILQDIRHHHGNPVAFFQSSGLQPGGDRAGFSVQFPVGQGLSHAGEGLAVGKLRTALFEKFDKGGMGGCGDFGRYARRIGCQPALLCADIFRVSQGQFTHASPPRVFVAPRIH